MTTATMTGCFQPNEYKDLALFANRTAELNDLVETLQTFLAADAPTSQARLLIRGPRGVGKSMLTRKAIEAVIARNAVLHVIVDGAEVERGTEPLIREISRDLGREATRNALDEGLQKSAELLLRFAETDKVTAKEVRTWSRTLNINSVLRSRFLESIQVEFGIAGAHGRTRTVEETYERKIDATFLRERIQDIATDARFAKQPVLLFVDNLDQVGYAEVEADVDLVMSLAKMLLGLRDCVVIANLRSEFVSVDLKKTHSLNKEVTQLGPDALVAIADARMGVLSADRKKKLKRAGFDPLVRQLSQWTTNAWGFLTWLADLDFTPIEFDITDSKALQNQLRNIQQRHFAGVPTAGLDSMAAAYVNRVDQYLTSDQLRTAGISDELRKRAVKYGAIVPDWLLSPDRYSLHPMLHCLAHQL